MTPVPNQSVTYYCPGNRERWGEGWHYITIAEELGLVSVHGDYISASHCWTSIGSDTLSQFLKRLGRDYFLGKLMGRDAVVIDVDELAAMTKRHISAERRAKRMSMVDVRYARDAVDDFRSCSTLAEIMVAIDGNSDVYDYLSGLDEFPYRANVMGTRFWNEVWLPFVSTLPVPVTD